MISPLEWIGYLASVLVLVSMLMRSVSKLRIVNLVGSTLFSIYGFMIGSMPVGFLNMFVVFANLYHLYHLYFVREEFKTLEIRNDNRYLISFLEFYNNDIQHFFPGFSYKPEMNKFSFLILRNMAVAGVFLARDFGNGRLYVGLDYVINQYRDLKPGKYIYQEQSAFFIEHGYNQICTYPSSEKHSKYLKQMGFTEQEVDGKKLFVLNLR
jgi:hypothetical protein